MRSFHVFLILSVLISCNSGRDEKISAKLAEIPGSIRNEHNRLIKELERISLLPDSTGIAGKNLISIVRYHFSLEERFALPPLGAIADLNNSVFPRNSKEIISMADSLKKQLNMLKAEHQMIHLQTKDLLRIAQKEGHKNMVKFYNDLTGHAILEEEVFYPAAIMTGEYLKLKKK